MNSAELTSNQISEENKVIVSDLYKLIKKYQAIRTIVRILVVKKNILHLQISSDSNSV